MSTKRFFGWVAVLSILALPMYASAEMKGHGDRTGQEGDEGGVHGHAGAFRRRCEPPHAREVHVQDGDRIRRPEGGRHVLLYVEISDTWRGGGATAAAAPLPPSLGLHARRI